MKKVITLMYCLLVCSGLRAQDILIRGISLIPMTGSNKVLKKQSVLIRGGKIREIGPFTTIKDKDSVTVIDGKGKYLMPGLADMHVHLPDAAKTDTLLMLNIAAGVTHIRVTNSRMPQQELQQKLAGKHSISPKIVYSHIIGKQTNYTDEQYDSLMQVIKNKDFRFIKLFSVSDVGAFEHLMRATQEKGVMVYGHYPQYKQGEKMVPVPMEKVLASGFRSIEHLGGYDEINDGAALQKAIRLTSINNVYNCPTLDWDQMAFDQLYPDAYKKRMTYNLLPEKYILNWEAEYAAAIEKGGGVSKLVADRDKYKPTFAKKKKILKMLADQNCPLLIGGDASGSFQVYGFNVYEEMINWSKAGLDNYTILKSATVTPAAFCKETEQWGTIETGKDADLVILDKNPLENIRNINTISSTIIDGRIYHKKEILGRL
jgi:dihydroorotase-like cyclic amidohydrolase